MKHLVMVGKVAAWISAVVPCLFIISKLTGFTAYANRSVDGDDSPELLILIVPAGLWLVATVTGLFSSGILIWKTRSRAGFVIGSICGLSFLILITKALA